MQGPSGKTAGQPARLAGVFAATGLLWACGGPAGTPGEAVAEWLEAAEAAAEAKDRAALVGMISPAYADSRGNDRDAIERRLRLYFLRQDEVALLARIEAIALSGGSAALLTVTVAMAGTESGTFGLSADVFRFELELEADNDEWLLIGARWGELGRDLR